MDSNIFSKISFFTPNNSPLFQAIASNICNELTQNFYNLSREITFEQIALVVNHNIQGVNAPLQERGQFFDTLNTTLNFESGFEDEEYIDYILLRNKIPDCNDDRISDDQICKEILIYDDNSTIDILYKNRLLYHQQILVDKPFFYCSFFKI